MSYLALARKWRPGTFGDLVGQSHVVKALTNSLESDRVHHAYLFSGTRGVGKTTVARIFAKALNCEQGVVAEPCGECGACVSIDEGRFVDLIEVDAASRTKVDDTRELLENVQYAPTSGRFKVYLIDEVHMLSNSSFNALLKTLEEPPPHVKFLLATTDPHKLPVTVLSRCLQFNLKRLPTTSICDRMAMICDSEGLSAEPAALLKLARAASGSMRDALSLLDQGLVFGGNQLTDQDAVEMLGSLDQEHISNLLRALAAGDAATLTQTIRSLEELVPDYTSVLAELATALQQIAVIQLAGIEALDPDMDSESLAEFADQFGKEEVQLYYEIACAGRRDLTLAPEPALGFEMCMLRMLAFAPGGTTAAPAGTAAPAATPKKKAPNIATDPAPAAAAPSSAPAAPAAPEATAPESAPPAQRAVTPDGWLALVQELKLSGMAGQLARNCALLTHEAGRIVLTVDEDNSHLLTANIQSRLQDALQEHFGGELSLTIDVKADAPVDSVAKRAADEEQDKLNEARAAIQTDPNVQGLVELFDASVDDDSIAPSTE